MFNVSADYKEQIEKAVRNVSHIKVNFGVVDPDASVVGDITDNGAMYYSNSSNTSSGEVITKRYLTFERNKFILDGVNLLPEPALVEYYQGFVSESISDSSGYFTTNPKVTIDFPYVFSFIGLTFRFNKYLNNYPSEIRIKAFNGLTEVYNQIHNPNNYEFVVNTPIPGNGIFCDNIEIEFIKTHPSNRRVELAYIMFGVVATFADDQIVNSIWDREVSLLSTRVPKNEFKFTIVDQNKDYNPENPVGVWEYLEERQPVWWQYGYELDNGTIEWVNGSTLFSVGKVRVEGKSNLSTVTFSTESLLNSLEETYYQGIYYPAGRSLYDLAMDVIAFADLQLLQGGVIPYTIDDALKDIYTKVPLPELKVKEVLQLIANAGRCVLDVNRLGQIVIKRHEPVVQDFKYDFNKMKSAPVLEKSQLLLSVDSFSNTVTVSPDQEEIHRSNLSLATATECLFKYDMSTNMSLGVSAGLTIIGTPTYFAGSCLATIIGEGEAIVTGYKLVFSKDGVSYQAGQTGFICPIENLLLNSSQDAQAYVQWVADILSRRNEYQIRDRGYPEIDINDIVLTDTQFSTDMEVTVTRSKITYNGTLSGETTYISEGVAR